MIRSLLSFCSLLAFAVLGAGAIIVVAPWLAGKTTGAPVGGADATGLHLESLLLGVGLGLGVSFLGRYDWAEIPRRAVTWILVRERQLFYYALVAGCMCVLLFY